MIHLKDYKKVLLWGLILAPYIIFPILIFMYFGNQPTKPPTSFIVIDKSAMILKAYDKNGQVILESQVATGKGIGNKKKVGDLKTPEGVFSISDIEDASTWKHDFKDDTLGLIDGAYGPLFIRLSVPGHKGIGIHGTHDPSSIGKRVTEGCIRLRNYELQLLAKIIEPGIPVMILPAKEDLVIHSGNKATHKNMKIRPRPSGIKK
jgi:lipoprotein-anchoring transpeptidase ErfK/SrfK